MLVNNKVMAADHLLAAIGHTVIVFDENGVFESVNGPLFRTLGFSEDPTNSRPLDVLHPDDRAIAVEAIIHVRTTGITTRRRIRAVHVDGSLRTFDLLFASALADPSINRLLVIASEEVEPPKTLDAGDVASGPTAMKVREASEQLRLNIDQITGAPQQATQFLNSVLSTTEARTVCVGVVDRAGECMTVVARSGEFDVGTSTSFVLRPDGPLLALMRGSRPIFLSDLNSVRDLAGIGEEATSMLFGKSPTGFVLPCVWGHTTGVVAIGGLRDEAIARHLRDEIASGARKIVEGWFNENRVKHEQQQRYSTILETSSDFVAIVDSEFRFAFVSPSLARLAGASVESLVGQPAFSWLKEPNLANAIRAVEPQRPVKHLIDTGPTPVGELTIDLTIRNMIDDPLVAGWLLNGRDVTATQLQLKRRQDKATWRAKIAALSTSIANLAPEELQTALEAQLCSFIQLLKADRCVVWATGTTADKTQLLTEVVAEGIVPVRHNLPEFDLAKIRALTDGARMVDERHERHEHLEDYVRIGNAPEIGASSFFPLRSGGAFIGLMLVLRLRDEAFDDESNLHAMALADTLAAALSRRAAIERLEAQALSDSLTNLGNRRELTNALARATSDPERSGGVGLVYCDVDNFKLINDSLGHDAGDEFLRETARRMQAASRASDTLIRLGGDEFVVLLDGIGSEDDAFHFAKHLRRAMTAPLTIRGRTFRSSVCMGVSFADRKQLAAEPSLLMTSADVALLEAKRAGEGEIAVFDAAQSIQVRKDVGLVSDLDQGINRDELRLYYQPIVDLKDPQRIVTVEGLVRWQHPVQGLVFPDVFIPIAENNKMITRITSFVMNEGLRALGEARCRGEIGNDTSLAINVTVRDLRSTDFVRRVERALEHSELDSSSLHVELTESSAIDDTRVFQTLLALRRIGVQIAIDDFGTGYASLSYLRDIPASVVKIDRTFVQQMDNRRDRSLIAAAIAMSHQLEMIVVAEGVETIEQAESLLEMGCDLGQGYLFARPTPDLASLTRATLLSASTAL